MLNKIKLALQLSGDVLDGELTDLMNAAVIDLNIAGVNKNVSIETTDTLAQRTIISYVIYQFELLHGSMERSAALKKVYDENKAMLSMSSNYTNFGG